MNDLYQAKVEQNVEYYGFVRTDVTDFIANYFSQHKISKQSCNALEVGSGGGGTGRLIKEKFGISKYTGVELMPEIALSAKKNIDISICGDFEKMMEVNNFEGIDKEKYGMILFLDTLEHLYHPWNVLKKVRNWMDDDGYLVLSIPNSGHISIIKKLLTDKFQYEKSGLLDFTHIRFFTFSTIKKMLEDNGYEIAEYTTLNDFKILKIKLFNFITFGAFKKQFISSYTLIAKKKKA